MCNLANGVTGVANAERVSNVVIIRDLLQETVLVPTYPLKVIVRKLLSIVNADDLPN
jgi:hypothetical protein